MEIKGTAVLTIQNFVKHANKGLYNEWVNLLPQASKEIFSNEIYPNQWYDVLYAAVEPSKAIGKMFYNNDEQKAAFESGRYSATQALTGIYKFFVKAASPGFIITRASYVFATYYRPCTMKVLEKADKAVQLRLDSDGPHCEVVQQRIAGWMERGLEISGCANIKIDIPKSIAKGDAFTQFSIKWA
ncbi:MAG: hypothetical protein HC896_14800 [Bacteroidales bacterium]|nr:hypothetical protein [Bacteroidales bacterium]